jgi:integrase
MAVRWEEKRKRWQARWRDVRGKQEARDFQLKREAEDWERARRTEVAAQRKKMRSVWVGRGNNSFIGFRHMWIKLQGGRLRPQTLAGYAAALEAASGPIDQTQVRHLDRTTLRLSILRLLPTHKHSTLRRYCAILGACLNHAVELGLLAENPAEGLAVATLGKARRDETVRSLAREQLRAFLTAAKGSRFEWAFNLMALAGLRQGEALALTWQDVDVTRKVIMVSRTLTREGTLGPTKSGKARSVDCCKALAVVLEAHRSVGGSTYLARELDAPDASTASRLQSAVDREARKVAKRAGLKAGCHSLRHSYARILMEDGVTPTYVSRQLGHASIGITVDLYGRHADMSDVRVVDALAAMVTDVGEATTSGNERQEEA